MSIQTLRPDRTLSSAGVSVTGATLYGALADDSDSTYASYLPSPSGGVGGIQVGFELASLPAGSVAARVMTWVRGVWTGNIDELMPGPTFLPVVPVTVDGVTSNVAQAAMVGMPFSTPTTFVAHQLDIPAAATSVDWANVQLAVNQRLNLVSEIMRLHEVYMDVVYVAQPTLEVIVGDTITDTNVPEVNWVTTLDADGGPQTRYEAKIFGAAEYSAGGFDAGAVTPAEGRGSGELAGADMAWQSTDALPDGTYRAYVRVAQAVNGRQLWSAWTYDEFAISVAPPAIPLLSTVADPANGAIGVMLDTGGGPVAANAFELQRSDDGMVSWGPVRTLDGAGHITFTGAALQVWDFEAPNGVAVTYRARALHNYGGLWAAGSWAQATGSWSSSRQWLKAPVAGMTPPAPVVVVPPTYGDGTYGDGTYGEPVPPIGQQTATYGEPGTYGDPGEYGDPLIVPPGAIDTWPNMQVVVHAYATAGRRARQGVMTPLGRRDTVIVSDTRGPWTGTIDLFMLSDEERLTLDALLDLEMPLLFQMGASDRRPDRWIMVGDSERIAVADKAFVESTVERLNWTEVTRPD